MELNKLQNLSCLTITGAMKMIPPPAINVLLELPPFHVMIEMKDQVVIYRIKCSQQWKLKSTNFGYAKKS
jgi:hypothetical protein